MILVNKLMDKITTINRTIATLTKLLAIKRGNKDVDINESAGSQYIILKTAFELYLDDNCISSQSFNSMIAIAKVFIQKTREKSYAKR